MENKKRESHAEFGDASMPLDKTAKRIIAHEDIRYYGNIFRNSVLKGTFVTAAIMSFVCGLSDEDHIAVGFVTSMILMGYTALFAYVNKGKWVL